LHPAAQSGKMEESLHVFGAGITAGEEPPMAHVGRHGRRIGQPRTGGPAARPRVERLECRCLPSVNLLSGFKGIDYVDTKSGEPPDTIIAAGPAHVVEAVNTSLTVYDKGTGALLFQQKFNQFFAPAGVGLTAFLSDPLVTYDDLAGRFVVSILEVGFSQQTSFLNLAVSNDSDPMDGFAEMHRIDIKESTATGAVWGDYPKVGWNADAYVYTVNMIHFSGAGEDFAHVQVITFGKASLLDADPSTAQLFRVDRTQPADFTLVPAAMHGAGPGAPMWLVEENDGHSNLRVVRMDSLLSPSPSFTDWVVPVASYSPVPPPEQPNGAAITTNIDSFMLNAALRGNDLVADQTVGNNGDDHARWYEFSLAGGSPVLTQYGEIDRGPGVDTYYPAIDIAPGGELGMTFLESGTQEFMSMYVTGRTSYDAVGVMQMPVLVRGGLANYKGSRAGDYSGISIDPVDGTIWAGNEYSNTVGTHNWGTWIAHFLPRKQVNFFATGADAGGGPDVRVFDADSGAFVRQIFAYAPNFFGGVRVAVGDLNADGVPDVITAPGRGAPPEIRVFDGVTGKLARTFLAYDASVLSGVFVAAGDVNGDGYADVITGADAGGGPHVKVFSGRDGSVLYSFFAYAADMFSGVRVAAGDVDGDGYADIITGAGAGGGPHVKVFSGADGSLLRSFFAYGTTFYGGVYVASADVDGDGKADIITGAGAGGGPHVEVFGGADGSLRASFFAYGATFFGGVRVGALSGTNGRAAILTAAGPGGGPHARVFDGLTQALMDSFFAYDASVTSGVFIGGR
jgi:hypothetical protein